MEWLGAVDEFQQCVCFDAALGNLALLFLLLLLIVVWFDLSPAVLLQG